MSVVRLPLETMNKVLGLLGTLPYTQVAELIGEVKEKSVVGDVGPTVVQGTPEDITTEEKE